MSTSSLKNAMKPKWGHDMVSYLSFTVIPNHINNTVDDINSLLCFQNFYGSKKNHNSKHTSLLRVTSVWPAEIWLCFQFLYPGISVGVSSHLFSTESTTRFLLKCFQRHFTCYFMTISYHWNLCINITGP